MILVCRPRSGAEATAAALRQAGWQALPMPVLAHEPVTEDAAMRARIQALAEYDLVVVVSPAAAELGMVLVERYWPQLPVALEWIAVGEGTRQVLGRHGVQALAPADERSEGMLQLVPFNRPQLTRALILRGVGGRGWLAEQLRARGLQVDFLELYRRVPQEVVWPDVDAVDALVITSVAVLDAVVAAGGLRYRARPVIVPSSRVADAARAAGFERIELAAGAGPAATVAAMAASCAASSEAGARDAGGCSSD